MDFTLALTHFCEAHGPKSVLCTQVQPVDCSQCRSPSLRSCSSSESLNTQVHESAYQSNHLNLPTPPSLRKTDTNITLPTDFSGASTTVDSETEPDSPTIEHHPLFKPIEKKRDASPQWRYRRPQGDTCASCSFSVPNAVAEKLPAGAPGSRNTDGKNKPTAPVLRSREFVCLRKKRRNSAYHASEDSKPSSYGSSTTSPHSRASSHTHSPTGAHPENCHDHTLTYLTAKSPADPESYARLRASVIRTLSCELLPRGISDGPFCFGDSQTGYTIAYVFRLTDPKARGRRRAYAFVALAGNDASRAFQACPLLWEAFANMAKGIEAAAQRHQEWQRRKEEKEAESSDAARSSARNYTPISSFLTARTVDPDGTPRRLGQTTPRSLAEIVGDENIFAFLHQYFVAILHCLGEQFGGLPLTEKPAVCQSVSEESPGFAQASIVRGRGSSLDPSHLETLRDENATPTPQFHAATSKTQTWPQTADATPTSPSAPKDKDDLEIAKTRANKAFKLSPQCAPLAVNEAAQRQVVV